MCTAKATLVYGLTMSSASLVFAADAWTRLSPSLPFFDLVFLRRRNGGLVSSSGGGYSAVTKVPNEVWEEVRHWLVQEEIADSEHDFLKDFEFAATNCSECQALGSCIRWQDLISRKEKCGVVDDFVDQVAMEFVSTWGKESISEIDRIVADFGLGLPIREPIRSHSKLYSDTNALALIAAPSALRKGESETPLVDATCGGDNGPDEQTLVDVSFKLPRNINQRFTRFIRLFDFEIANSSVNKIISIAPPSTAVNEKKKKSSKVKTSGVRNDVTNEIKPSWKLYLTCETTW